MNAKAIEVERVLLEAEAKQKEAVTLALEEARAEHKHHMKEVEKESSSILKQEQKRLSLLAEQETERAVAAATEEHDAITKALRANLEASELLRSEDKESFAFQLEQVKANAEDSMKSRLADLERQTREQYVLDREKAQRDFDLHIALQVNKEKLLAMMKKGHAEKIETRGVADHGFIESIYFRDPNGYVVELSAPKGDKPLRDIDAANAILRSWQETKLAP